MKEPNTTIVLGPRFTIEDIMMLDDINAYTRFIVHHTANLLSSILVGCESIRDSCNISTLPSSLGKVIHLIETTECNTDTTEKASQLVTYLSRLADQITREIDEAESNLEKVNANALQIKRLLVFLRNVSEQRMSAPPPQDRTAISDTREPTG